MREETNVFFLFFAQILTYCANRNVFYPFYLVVKEKVVYFAPIYCNNQY